MQGKLDTLHIWSLVIMALLIRLFLKKPVKKGEHVLTSLTLLYVQLIMCVFQIESLPFFLELNQNII